MRVVCIVMYGRNFPTSQYASLANNPRGWVHLNPYGYTARQKNDEAIYGLKLPQLDSSQTNTF